MILWKYNEHYCLVGLVNKCEWMSGDKPITNSHNVVSQHSFIFSENSIDSRPLKISKSNKQPRVPLGDF